MSAAVDLMEEPEPKEQHPWRALARRELEASLGRPRWRDQPPRAFDPEGALDSYHEAMPRRFTGGKHAWREARWSNEWGAWRTRASPW